MLSLLARTQANQHHHAKTKAWVDVDDDDDGMAANQPTIQGSRQAKNKTLLFVYLARLYYIIARVCRRSLYDLLAPIYSQKTMIFQG